MMLKKNDGVCPIRMTNEGFSSNAASEDWVLEMILNKQTNKHVALIYHYYPLDYVVTHYICPDAQLTRGSVFFCIINPTPNINIQTSE